MTDAATGFALDPRLAADSHGVAELALSSLRLMDDSQYPWLILVPRVAGARELIDLDPAQRRQLGAETDQAARLLRQAFAPFKLNVAALGNVVEQLHVHVIARFRDDPAWPAPVWGRLPVRPYVAEHLAERLHRLRAVLAG